MGGSPPHTRGKVHGVVAGYAKVRITPAHAGKRGDVVPALPLGGDHPRTRGEKSMSAPPPLSVVGSPPHTRGKAIDVVKKLPAVRITPAHAGKSLGIDGTEIGK